MPEIPNISKHVKLTPLEGNAIAYIDVKIELEEQVFLDILQTTATFEGLLIKLSLAGNSVVKDLANVNTSVVCMLLNTARQHYTIFNWTSIDPYICIDHAYAILKELAEEIDLSKHFTAEAILEIIADFTRTIDKAYSQYSLDIANRLKDFKAKLISRMSIGFGKKF